MMPTAPLQAQTLQPMQTMQTMQPMQPMQAMPAMPAMPAGPQPITVLNPQTGKPMTLVPAQAINTGQPQVYSTQGN